MNTFGKRLRESRKEKKYSQSELAKMLKTNHSVIGKYERDEVIPSIEAVKKIAQLLDTTVAYLIGESEDDMLFKDPEMMTRFKEINSLPEEVKQHILYNIDAVLRDFKTQRAYAS